MNDDVLTGPALGLVLALESRGAKFRIDGQRISIGPAGLLTADERETLARHYDEVRFVIAVATDVGVEARRDAFRAQLHDATTPAFIFRANVPYLPEVCFSCGEVSGRSGFGRCWRCSVAWRMAAGLPVSTELAAALDEARRA